MVKGELSLRLPLSSWIQHVLNLFLNFCHTCCSSNCIPWGPSDTWRIIREGNALYFLRPSPQPHPISIEMYQLQILTFLNASGPAPHPASHPVPLPGCLKMLPPTADVHQGFFCCFLFGSFCLSFLFEILVTIRRFVLKYSFDYYSDNARPTDQQMTARKSESVCHRGRTLFSTAPRALRGNGFLQAWAGNCGRHRAANSPSSPIALTASALGTPSQKSPRWGQPPVHTPRSPAHVSSPSYF